MDAKELYELKQAKEALEKNLISLTDNYKNNLYDFVKDYFKDQIPKELAISKNQFIQINWRDFTIEKGESGKIYWKTKGAVITVKDGKVTNGYSTKELYQGEFENFSEELKSHTIEKAKEMSKSVFPLFSRYNGGTDYGAIGYELARNNEAKIALVWRKSSTNYIDRMSKSMSFESELQILKIGDVNENKYEKLKVILKELEEKIGNEKFTETFDVFKHSGSSAVISKGGRLKKDVILKNNDIISALFGDQVVNDIITKLDVHLKRKKIPKEQEDVKEKKIKP